MKPNATKSPNRKAGLQTAGRRWNPMKRSLLRVALMAVLCALSTSSALAQYSLGVLVRVADYGAVVDQRAA